MTPIDRTPEPDLENRFDNPRDPEAPEAVNQEQRDFPQAQDVADEAKRLAGDPNEESVHGGPVDPAALIPPDTQDVVDHMTQMVEDGRIDYDAYRGERSDDDEPDQLGVEGMEMGDMALPGDTGAGGQAHGAHINADRD